MKDTPIVIAFEKWVYDTFLPENLRAELNALSSNITYIDTEGMEPDAWLAKLTELQPEILIGGWTTPGLPSAECDATKNLKYVCSTAGSIKGLVPVELIERGVVVTNWGDAVSRVVAECGLMLMIAALRRASYWTVNMHKSDAWKERSTVQFGSAFEKKVGLHGFGVISRELVKLLKPFNVEISTYSPSVPEEILTEFDVKRAPTLEALFSENEVVIELAALTPKNTGIVTEELLRMIPEGGVFVNIGRGAVVDEEALGRVAAEGKIQVALDVYGEEPLPVDSPFRKNESVMLLPHLGGPTVDRRQDAGAIGVENIKRYLKGEALEAQVDAGVYARST